jgi:HD-GYP domain-containing protein (c-di-GMP phosphodiesterase class II)
MGLTAEQMDDLERGSLLHDIGKIGIPLIVLDKQGKLTPEEYDLVKSHPSTGSRILSPIRAYAGIIPIVEQHHERFDGKGYPNGLKGNQTHIGARIIAVADSFDAMVSDRPYRSAMGRQRAIEIIREEAGFQFDPEVARVFDRVVQQTDAPIHAASTAEGFLLSFRETKVGHYIPDTPRPKGEKREIKP